MFVWAYLASTSSAFKSFYYVVLGLTIKLQCVFLVHLYSKIWCVIFELRCLHDLLFLNFNDQLLGAEELF